MRYVSETTKKLIIGNRVVKGENDCIEKDLGKTSEDFHGLEEEVKSKWKEEE